MLPVQAYSGQPRHGPQAQAGLDEMLDLGRRALVQIRSGSIRTGVRTSEPDEMPGQAPDPLVLIAADIGQATATLRNQQLSFAGWRTYSPD